MAVFAGIDRDSKSLQQFEVGHEGDVGETKGARQVFVAVELGLDPVECLDDRCSGIVDPLPIAFSLGLAHFLHDVNTGDIKVSVAKIFHEPRPRPRRRIVGADNDGALEDRGGEP